MPQYWLDANVFIEANNSFISLDLAPAFWIWLETNLKADVLCSSSMVYDEILVERMIDTLVVNVARVKHSKPSDFEARLDEEIRTLKRALQSEPTPWEFYTPVVWLAPSELPFKVGRVEFYHSDHSGKQEYWRRVSELNPTYAGTDPENFLAIDFPVEFGNKSIARVQVAAVDVAAAQTLAIKAVRQTLDCLNFYSDKLMGTGLHLRGDVEQGQRIDGVIHVSPPVEPSGRTTRLAPWRSLPIKQISKRPAFDRISKLLENNRPTPLESRILKAVQWAGRARVEQRIEQSFLLFAVALETLLLIVVLDREPFRTMTAENELEDWFEERLLGPNEPPAVGYW